MCLQKSASIQPRTSRSKFTDISYLAAPMRHKHRSDHLSGSSLSRGSSSLSGPSLSGPNLSGPSRPGPTLPCIRKDAHMRMDTPNFDCAPMRPNLPYPIRMNKASPRRDYVIAASSQKQQRQAFGTHPCQTLSANPENSEALRFESRVLVQTKCALA